MLFQLPALQPVKVVFTELDMPWWATPEWWVAVGTVALSIVTFFLAFYTYRLFKATMEARADSLQALVVAKRNAEIADKSVQLAQASMLSTLRAYVVIDSVTNRMADLRLFQIADLVIKNTGQTPAIQVTVLYTYSFDPPEFISQSRNGWERCQCGIMAKDCPYPISLKIEFGEMLEPVRAKQNLVYVYGTISYQDMLSKQMHETTFLYEWEYLTLGFAPHETMNTMS